MRAVCLLPLLFPLLLQSAEIVSGGRVQAAVVLSKKASETERFAAKELIDGIRKRCGAELPLFREGEELPHGMLPIRFTVDPDDSRLRDDGFAVTASPQGVTVTGRKLRSMIYGSCFLLRKYGGIRWLYPGDEGEVVPKSPDFTIPDGTIVRNPAFAMRTPLERGRFGRETKLFLVRSGLSFRARSFDKTFAMPCRTGDHEISKLLIGFSSGKEWDAAREKLFQEHPDYFGLRDGKRVTTGNWLSRTTPVCHPCTSNREVQSLMCRHLREKIRSFGGKELVYSILPDDHVYYCQCPECRKLDIGNKISSRWWHLAGILADAGEGAVLEIGCYHDLLTVPDVPMDSRVIPLLFMQNRCGSHALDSDCPFNRNHQENLRAFAAKGMHPDTYEMHGSLPGTYQHLYLEKVWVRDLQFYHRLGFSGFGTNFYSADGTGKSDLRRYSYAAFWYLTAHFAWDIDDDPDSILAEFGQLYFGPAASLMAETRNILEQAASKEHIRTGSGNALSVGAGLTEHDVARLEDLFAQAEERVKDAPLFRKRVQLEKFFFREEQLSAYRLSRKKLPAEYAVARLSAPPGEADWKKAEALDLFLLCKKLREPENRCAVKILRDSHNLYFSIAAESSPHPDTHLYREPYIAILLTPAADGRGPYRQYALSASGKSQVLHYQDKAKVREVTDSRMTSRIQQDGNRWQARISIPLAELTGMPPSVWRFNLLHQSFTSSGEKEISSCSAGAGHGGEKHLKLLLQDTANEIGNGEKEPK